MSPDRYGHLPAPGADNEGRLTREQSLQRLAETADYVSQRASQLDVQVQAAEQIITHLSALARQLRTLSSNTALEATRMQVGGPLAEIARQMRRISQQISESNDQLGLNMRAYAAATGDLRQAAALLLDDAAKVKESPEPESEPDTVRLRYPPSRPTVMPPRTAPEPWRRSRPRVDPQRDEW